MNKILLFITIAFFLTACKKSDFPDPGKTEPVKLGYDHGTPQGQLLTQISSGSNKNLKTITYNYYNSTGTLLFSNKVTPAANVWLLFHVDFTINTKYNAGAITEGDSHWLTILCLRSTLIMD
jgi:hypothetical protein